MRITPSNTEPGGPWAVIFDMDGTMVDNRAYHEAAWIELGHRYQLPITAEFYRQKLHSKSNAVIIRALFGAQADHGLIRRITDEKELIYRELYAPHAREVPGLTALLVELQKDAVPCAVVSNSPRVNVDFILDRLDLRDFFRCTLTADEVTRSKPDPELVCTAAATVGVSPARCMVLEDSVSGFLSAERAGAPYVIITYDADPAHVAEFRNRAAAVYNNFTEICPLRLRELLAWKQCKGQSSAPKPVGAHIAL